MKHGLARRVRTAPTLLVGTCIAAATVSVSPCFADEPTARQRRPLTISDAALRSAVGSAVPARPVVARQTTAEAPRGSAFFKTPKGEIVLVLLGAGIGYGVYSKVHDRVHSPNPAR